MMLHGLNRGGGGFVNFGHFQISNWFILCDLGPLLSVFIEENHDISSQNGLKCLYNVFSCINIDKYRHSQAKINIFLHIP